MQVPRTRPAFEGVKFNLVGATPKEVLFSWVLKLRSPISNIAGWMENEESRVWKMRCLRSFLRKMRSMVTLAFAMFLGCSYLQPFLTFNAPLLKSICQRDRPTDSCLPVTNRCNSGKRDVMGSCKISSCGRRWFMWTVRGFMFVDFFFFFGSRHGEDSSCIYSS